MFDELLSDVSPYVRIQAAYSLCIEGPHERSIDLLISLMDDNDRLVRTEAVRVMSRLKMTERAVPSLIKLLGDASPEVQAIAARTLGAWGPQAAAMPILLNLIKSDLIEVSTASANALIAYGRQDSLVGELSRLLQDESEETQLMAVNVLGEWGYLSDAVSALSRLSDSKKARTCAGAIYLLSRWNNPEALLEWQQSIVSVIREDVVEDVWLILSEMSSTGPQRSLLPAVQEAMESRSSISVLYSAIILATEMGKIEEALTVVIRMFESDSEDECGDAEIAISAICAFGRTRECFDCVLRLLRVPKGDITIATEWIVQTSPTTFAKRSHDASDILSRLLKRQPRDSVMRRSLRSALYQMIWDANDR